MAKPKTFAVLGPGGITVHYESSYQPADGRRNAMCARMWPLAKTRSGKPAAGTLCEGCARAQKLSVVGLEQHG